MNPGNWWMVDTARDNCIQHSHRHRGLGVQDAPREWGWAWKKRIRGQGPTSHRPTKAAVLLDLETLVRFLGTLPVTP